MENQREHWNQMDRGVETGGEAAAPWRPGTLKASQDVEAQKPESLAQGYEADDLEMKNRYSKLSSLSPPQVSPADASNVMGANGTDTKLLGEASATNFTNELAKGLRFQIPQKQVAVPRGSVSGGNEKVLPAIGLQSKGKMAVNNEALGQDFQSTVEKHQQAGSYPGQVEGYYQNQPTHHQADRGQLWSSLAQGGDAEAQRAEGGVGRPGGQDATLPKLEFIQGGKTGQYNLNTNNQRHQKRRPDDAAQNKQQVKDRQHSEELMSLREHSLDIDQLEEEGSSSSCHRNVKKLKAEKPKSKFKRTPRQYKEVSESVSNSSSGSEQQIKEERPQSQGADSHARNKRLGQFNKMQAKGQNKGQNDDVQSYHSRYSSKKDDMYVRYVQNRLMERNKLGGAGTGAAGQNSQLMNSADNRPSKGYEEHVAKIVTVLFMSHRIQAKIYDTDTLTSFLERMRKILSNIDKHQQIGLYHLYFLKQEEDGNHGTLRNTCIDSTKDGKKKRTRSINLSIQSDASRDASGSRSNSVVSVNDMIPTPLKEQHIAKDLSQLADNQNYLIVYIDNIKFQKPFQSGKPSGVIESNKSQKGAQKSSQADRKEKPYHERLPLGKTYFKVLRGTTTANRMLFCSYSQCVKQFTETGNLKTHMRTHTNDRPFSCAFKGCGKSFITKGHLQTHILIHTGEKPYSCDICGKSYARSGRLKIHKRTHTGEKPFKCEVCGTCFTENGNLKTHMRIHTGEKPFRCEFKGCGKSFTTQGHLIDHKRKHTNTRPFECEVCMQTFMRQSTLKLHMKRHQGGHHAHERFQCTQCNLQFAQQSELGNHMRMHHLEQGSNEQSPQPETQQKMNTRSISKNGNTSSEEKRTKVEPEKKRQRISEEAGSSAQKQKEELERTEKKQSGGGLKLDLKKVNEDIDKLEGIQNQSQTLFLDQQHKQDQPMQVMLDPTSYVVGDKPLLVLKGANDEDGLTPLNMDLQGIELNQKSQRPNSIIIDDGNRGQKQPKVGGLTPGKHQHQLITGTPMQQVKGDLSVLNNRRLLYNFEQAQADAQGLEPMDASGLHIRPQQSQSPEAQQHQIEQRDKSNARMAAASSSPDGLRNIDDQSVTQLRKQITGNTMMNLSQIDLNTKTENMQNFQMMFENQQFGLAQRYHLFKDAGNGSLNMLMGGTDGIDATPGTRTVKRKNNMMFPGQGVEPTSKVEDEGTSGKQGSTKVQVDFTMMSSIRQQQMQNQMQEQASGSVCKDNQHQDQQRDQNKQENGGNLTSHTIKQPIFEQAITKFDMQKTSKEVGIKQILNKNNTAIFNKQQIDQSTTNNNMQGIGSKNFTFATSKVASQLAEQVAGSANGGSSRNKQIRIVSLAGGSRKAVQNQMNFTHRLVAIQPRDGSSTNRNKYLKLPPYFALPNQVCYEATPKNLSLIKSAELNQLQNKEQEQRANVATLNMREQFKRSMLSERGQNTKITKQLESSQAGTFTGRHQAGTSSGQNQNTGRSASKSSPKFAKLSAQKKDFDSTKNQQTLLAQGRSQKPTQIQTNVSIGEGEAIKASNLRPNNQQRTSPTLPEGQNRLDIINDNGNTQSGKFRVPNALSNQQNVQMVPNIQIQSTNNRVQGGQASDTMSIRQQVRTPSAYITRVPSVPRNLVTSEQRKQDVAQWTSVQIPTRNIPSTGKISPNQKQLANIGQKVIAQQQLQQLNQMAQVSNIDYSQTPRILQQSHQNVDFVQAAQYQKQRILNYQSQVRNAKQGRAFMTPQNRDLTPQSRHRIPLRVQTQSAANLNQKIMINKNNGAQQQIQENISQRSEAAASNAQPQQHSEVQQINSATQISKPIVKLLQNKQGQKVASAINLLQIQNQAQSHQQQFLQTFIQEPISGTGITVGQASSSVSVPKSIQSPDQLPASLDHHQVSLVEQIHHNQMKTNQILTEILQNQRKIEMKQNEHDKLISQNLVAGHHHALKKSQGKKQQIQIIIQDPAGNSSMRNSILSQSADDASPNRLIVQKLPLNAKGYEYVATGITPKVNQNPNEELQNQPQFLVQGQRIPIASPGKRLDFSTIHSAYYQQKNIKINGNTNNQTSTLSPHKNDYQMLTPMNQNPPIFADLSAKRKGLHRKVHNNFTLSRQLYEHGDLLGNDGGQKSNPTVQSQSKHIGEASDSLIDQVQQQASFRPENISISQISQREGQSLEQKAAQAASTEKKAHCESRPSTLRDVEVGGGGFADHAQKAIQYMDHVRQLQEEHGDNTPAADEDNQQYYQEDIPPDVQEQLQLSLQIQFVDPNGVPINPMGLDPEAIASPQRVILDQAYNEDETGRQNAPSAQHEKSDVKMVEANAVASLAEGDQTADANGMSGVAEQKAQGQGSSHREGSNDLRNSTEQ